MNELIKRLESHLKLYECFGDYTKLPKQMQGQIDGLTWAIEEAKELQYEDTRIKNS